jgi:predicted NBD/HSP70 family sugar kinase
MNNDRVYYSHDAEMQAMRERTMLAVVFLTVGLGIGAALAFLFAPSSGKTTRHDLARNVEEGLHIGRDAVEPMVKRVEKEFSDLQRNVEEHLKQS